MKYFVCLPILFLLAASQSQAKLAKSSFTNLLKESDLIVEASVKKIERTGIQRGFATLTILRIISGDFDQKEITIAWGDEVHDQQIDSMTTDRLLFLRKQKNGSYKGSHYGRSYWPFNSRVTDPKRAKLDSDGRGFFYQYPLNMISFNKMQKKSFFDGEAESHHGKKFPYINMRKLKEYITRHKK